MASRLETRNLGDIQFSRRRGRLAVLILAFLGTGLAAVARGQAGAGLAGIAAGPDGNVWFTEGVGNKIGRITPAGDVTEFPPATCRGSLRPTTALLFLDQRRD